MNCSIKGSSACPYKWIPINILLFPVRKVASKEYFITHTKNLLYLPLSSRCMHHYFALFSTARDTSTRNETLKPSLFILCSLSLSPSLSLSLHASFNFPFPVSVFVSDSPFRKTDKSGTVTDSDLSDKHSYNTDVGLK